jgi:hypothetical protein
MSSPSGSRYEYLRHTDSNRDNLHQSAKLLHQLIGLIVETMRFLGPEKCALPIIDGRLDDGTIEI